jgi:hypothetical protein
MIQQSYRGLSLILTLNWERLLFPLAIIVGLSGGAIIGTELMQIYAPQAPGFN